MRPFGSVRIVAVVVALCLVCVALAVWTLVQSRHAALTEGERRVEGVALVLEQQADQMLATVEHLLDLTSASVRDHGLTKPHARDLEPMIASAAERLPQLRAVHFVDEHGRQRRIGAPLEAAHVEVSQKAFFQRHRADPSIELKLVDPEDHHAEGRRRLFMSRRLESALGAFAGVLLVEIDLDYLQQLYDRIQLTAGSSIGLVTMAGRLVVRFPHSEPRFDEDFSGLLNGRPPAASEGAGSVVSPVDGKVRLVGYRILSRYPLLVYASMPRAEVLAEWRANGFVYLSFAGALLGLVAFLAAQTVREIRQRRAAERSMRRSLVDLQRQKALVDAILAALPDGTQLFDGEQRMIGWNDRLFSILRVDRQDVFAAPDPTHRFFEILARRGEYGPGDIEDLIRSRLEITRTTERFQYIRRLADGRWMECRGQPIPGLGVLAVYRDITAEAEHEARMKAVQSSLEEARLDAERANRAKSEFLAGMSHELRTPLNAILGFSEVIGGLFFGRDAIDRYAEYGRDINSGATHLLALIDSLLDLAKIEAGRMELHEETGDVQDCVDRTLAMCRPVASAKDVDLVLGGIPRIAFRADRQKVVQSLLNVVSNAIKFTPAGGRVTVSAAHRREGLAFIVADTGIGIAEKDIPKVFEAFRQVESGRSMNAKGTGLGMPLTRHLIELHGGTVSLESEVGVGTTVTLTLPADRIVGLAAA